jgi:hypothetical protein
MTYRSIDVPPMGRKLLKGSCSSASHDERTEDLTRPEGPNFYSPGQRPGLGRHEIRALKGHINSRLRLAR